MMIIGLVGALVGFGIGYLWGFIWGERAGTLDTERRWSEAVGRANDR
jgi:membrane protein DedA with SNARE-associated domain